MENRKERSLEEQLLARILDECMEEQLSFVPPEREIAHMHKFSPGFRERMAELMEGRRKRSGKRLEKHEFIYGFNKAAACILVVFLVGAVGGLGYLSLGSLREKSTSTDTYDAGEINGASAQTSQETAEGGAEAGGTEEESVCEDTAAASSPAGSERIPKAEFMGQMLEPALEQELPAKMGNVKTLVNSPAISRDAREIMLTIGNQEEYTIYYHQYMELEVLIDGYWYHVPPLEEPTEEERRQMVALEPDMAQDVAILLEDYTLDYEAEAYRLVTYLDSMTLCSEFRFEEEEVFGEEEQD